MAFKIWQIGLHLQQQEAVAVAIVRGAKECFLQRWWRLPLENDIIKDRRIVDAQQLAKTLLPWSRELPQRHHIMLAFPASRTLQRSFPRPSMSLGEREQTAWLSGTMARELDMDPDSLRFDYSEDSLSPAYNVTAAQSKELAAALSVDPESVAICGEGGFDPWEAVSVRQPPLPPPGGDFAIALGLALGKAY